MRGPAQQRWRLIVAWAIVLAAAAGLRAAPLLAGRPYLAYIDEGNLLHPVARMLDRGGWDPGWYRYPQLPVTLIAAATRGVAAVTDQPLAGRVRWGGPYYDVLEPFSLLVCGRLVALVAGMGVVALTGWLARRLAGEAAGLAALAIAAVTPALAVRGALATVDPLAALFALAALAAAQVGSRRALFLAGAFAGCAFASKYGAVLVIVAPVVTALADPAWRWREKLGRLALAGAGLAAGIALAMPAVVVHGELVLEALREQSTIYSAMEPTATLAQQTFVRAEWDLPYERPELGWALCALAVAGLVLALRDRRLRPRVAGWLAWLFVTVAVFAPRPFQPFRNLLPLVPVAVIGAAFAFARLRERARRPWLVDLAVVTLCAYHAVPLAGHALERARLKDSRHEAVAWLRAHSPGTGAVTVAPELAFLPSELARLERPLSADGELLLLPDGARVPPGYRQLASFGWHPTPREPGHWHGNGQIIRLYQLRRRR